MLQDFFHIYAAGLWIGRNLAEFSSGPDAGVFHGVVSRGMLQLSRHGIGSPFDIVQNRRNRVEHSLGCGQIGDQCSLGSTEDDVHDLSGAFCDEYSQVSAAASCALGAVGELFKFPLDLNSLLQAERSP